MPQYSELFKRMIGSAPGYETRPQAKQEVQDVEVKYMEIRNGKVTGWGILK